MHVDIGKVLHVLAHELRTPAGIAQGYIRMLLDERLVDPADRRRALEQAQKALARVSELTHESTRLANWIEADRSVATALDVGTFIDRVVASAAVDPTPIVRLDSAVAGRRVETVDADALVTAIAAFLRATSRELRGAQCSLDARVHHDRMLDVLMAPAAQLDALADGPGTAAASGLALERGGLGLSLVSAAVVLEAHAAFGWTANGSRTTVGIRLPLEERALQ